ncbi:Similar to MAP kinase kinase kinase wis4; acc. no. O14299 [Pyronema omphalodes CBS 100304]|uniref:MAP kinase kinase kinase n=1 Tax=Pyronema omphalodes (strain CBS 100304) TaxID=1076935 RepID=U4LEC2_PYROM|nr:Similar to MAP kinase kinase kinase wis4; acc. no. O14299 [Pyronema omphalodes CBS 100304]
MPDSDIAGGPASNGVRTRTNGTNEAHMHRRDDADQTPGVEDDGDDDEAIHRDISNGSSGSVLEMRGANSFSNWSSNSTRPRKGSGTSPYPPDLGQSGRLSPDGVQPPAPRLQRPAAPVRTPSSTYAPVRHPVAPRARDPSTTRPQNRRDPNALYRSQEGAYVRRLRQSADGDYFNPQNSFYGESELDDESPSTEGHFDNSDLYDGDTLLLYGQDDMEPSAEELKIPENRERLEWHSMLASVLMGDVVKQEKKRLIGPTEEKEIATMKTELFLGIRARVCGRSVAAQRRMVDDGQSKVEALIDEITHFEIQGKDKTDKTPREQVHDILLRWERCEMLWPTREAMIEARPNAASAAFNSSLDALVAWNNTTELINTELTVLQNWVGNEDLDFQRTTVAANNEAAGIDREASFLDRILKDDNLKSLTGESNMLSGLSSVIAKAKTTLIEYAEAFEKRHLPPYVEELLVLIGFPTRLIEEVIGMRLQYAERMREPVSMMTDQLISQFQSVLQLAVKIKQEYTHISEPEPGWDLPPCMDENFEQVVLQGLKYYFKLIGWRIGSNRNTFKEAEILETEWHFSNEIGRYIEGGDLEVAEHFSSLTSKLLTRLMAHFEKELQKTPEKRGDELSKRYKSVLDSVRVRQRKLFRFARLLSQRFENSTEYNVDRNKLRHLVPSLIQTGHFLILNDRMEQEGIYMIADPSLYDRPHQIQSILRTCYYEDADRYTQEGLCSYVLVISVQESLIWDGRTLPFDMKDSIVDIKPGRLRLVADGSEVRLLDARMEFANYTAHDLDVLLERRANLPRVNQELMKIKKTTYRLSNTIMDSVEKIRRQTTGLGCQELIQTCFAFATEFGQRSQIYMDNNRRALNNIKLTKLAVDWVSFICDDCIATNRLTFRWAVVALEFCMVMTRGQNILSFNDQEYTRLRAKVAGCMSLLISHFDIMGARSTLAAKAEKRKMEVLDGQLKKMDISNQLQDEEASTVIRKEWMRQLEEIESSRKHIQTERQALGRVLDDNNQADRSLTYLSKSSFSNVSLRWAQGEFVGGGNFGTVYIAMNLDSGYPMAVKEIRLQDPQVIPQIATAIRDEMMVLELLDHPNIVQYFGIEVHRDKVYLFMEFCSGGSLASLLEHGRIEDETVIMIYTLQMLEGLAYLHENNIVHRDIKPESKNIDLLLDHNGIIKYVDFGAAKIIAKQGKTRNGGGGATRTNLNSMTGTPMYMSPEVITGSNKGRHGSIDIWSLGCVVLEMATGRRPWANLDNEWAIMWNIAAGHPPQLPTPDQLSDLGIDFLKKCFERDPKVRPSAAELLQHDWILNIRSQVIEPGTPSSESSSSVVSSTR